MVRGIYLRANGELNCYCSSGEQIRLGMAPLDRDDWYFIDDYYLSPSFSNVRTSIANDILPFPTYCLKCHFLFAKKDAAIDKLHTEIEWIHAEPSALCNLKCPYCVHGIPENKRTYSRNPPHFLPKALYNKLISDISDAGMSLKWGYFSGRGEPGLHPHLWDMISFTKQKLDTNFLINTNGNIKYTDAIVESGLDKIKIAIDSIDQAIYAKYRIGGNVDTLLKLTESIANRKKHLGVSHPKIIWQKVLFDFNDSDEQIRSFEKVATECGVDQIWYVITFTDRYTRRPVDKLPITFPDVHVKDCRDRANISAESVAQKLRRLQGDPRIDDGIFLASRILHRFELSIKNRDKYDEFANVDFCSKEFWDAWSDDLDVNAYQSALGTTFSILADLYTEKSPRNSVLYSQWARRMETIRR